MYFNEVEWMLTVMNVLFVVLLENIMNLLVGEVHVSEKMIKVYTVADKKVPILFACNAKIKTQCTRSMVSQLTCCSNGKEIFLLVQYCLVAKYKSLYQSGVSIKKPLSAIFLLEYPVQFLTTLARSIHSRYDVYVARAETGFNFLLQN